MFALSFLSTVLTELVYYLTLITKPIVQVQDLVYVFIESKYAQYWGQALTVQAHDQISKIKSSKFLLVLVAHLTIEYFAIWGVVFANVAAKNFVGRLVQVIYQLTEFNPLEGDNVYRLLTATALTIGITRLISLMYELCVVAFIVPRTEEAFKRMISGLLGLAFATHKKYCLIFIQIRTGMYFGLLEWWFGTGLFGIFRLIAQIVQVIYRLNLIWSGLGELEQHLSWISYHCLGICFTSRLLFCKLMVHASMAFNEPTTKNPYKKSYTNHQYWNMVCVLLQSLCELTTLTLQLLCLGGGNESDLRFYKQLIVLVTIFMTMLVLYLLEQFTMRGTVKTADRLDLLMNLDLIVEKRLDLQRIPRDFQRLARDFRPQDTILTLESLVQSKNQLASNTE